MQTESGATDFQAITKKQQAVWATGDFHQIALTVMQAAEDLVRAADPHPGQKVLDVACGSGNAALVAARRYCEVTGVDYVPELIEHAKMRAAAESTRIDFRVADAQALPFADGSFDVVLSIFGVMFAPDRDKAAAELLRVCRKGGKIALASWTPEGFAGQFFKLQSQYVPPPPGVQPPPRWGTEALLQELLGKGCSGIEAERRMSHWYYHSAEHAVEVFRTYFGPTARAFQALDADKQAAFGRELVELFGRHNTAKDGTLHLQSEFLLSIATRS
jgi:ubiquinone/menaquinone biosynthesis C-methylase UbiE